MQKFFQALEKAALIGKTIVIMKNYVITQRSNTYYFCKVKAPEELPVPIAIERITKYFKEVNFIKEYVNVKDKADVVYNISGCYYSLILGHETISDLAIQELLYDEARYYNIDSKQLMDYSQNPFYRKDKRYFFVNWTIQKGKIFISTRDYEIILAEDENIPVEGTFEDDLSLFSPELFIPLQIGVNQQNHLILRNDNQFFLYVGGGRTIISNCRVAPSFDPAINI